MTTRHLHSSQHLVLSKSLIQDMFGEQKTALILDELQTWYDGLHNEPGPEGKKHLQWAFNFIQILSEIAEDRPDLFSLIVSVRDNTTDAFKQIHRKSPVVIDFKGETAREDRKRLVLHRLFKNRSNIPSATIEQTVSAYAKETDEAKDPSADSNICMNAASKHNEEWQEQCAWQHPKVVARNKLQDVGIRIHDARADTKWAGTGRGGNTKSKCAGRRDREQGRDPTSKAPGVCLNRGR